MQYCIIAVGLTVIDDFSEQYDYEICSDSVRANCIQEKMLLYC